MPGPAPLVTREEVFKAADEFLESGIWPSARRIQRHLGKSSTLTIHNILMLWREGKSKDVLMLPDVVVPAELIAAVKKTARTYAGIAVSRAREKILRLEEECDLMANEALALQMEIERMHGEVEHAKECRIRSEGRASVFESSLNEEKQRVDALNERLQESERKLDRAEAKLCDAQRLNDDQQKFLSSVQAQLDIERSQTRNLKSEIEKLERMLKNAPADDE